MKRRFACFKETGLYALINFGKAEVAARICAVFLATAALACGAAYEKKSVSVICSALSSVIAVARVLSFILFLKFCVRLSFPFARGQNGKGNESYVRADDDADNETVNHNIPRNTIIDRSGGFYTRRAGILVFYSFFGLQTFSDFTLLRQRGKGTQRIHADGNSYGKAVARTHYFD